MIEISFGKLVLLALIALIVLGPEKLPGAARTAGALLRRMRSGWDNVRAEVERELQIEEIRRTAREAAARAEAAQAELDAAVQKVRDVGNEIPPSAATAVEASGEPPVMLPLAQAPPTPATAADAAGSDDRTGDLFATVKSPAEPPHGHA
ncbi:MULTISPECIES: Sec-independent protein translocase protein TatB [Rhodanobacter]|uniref:Sec-independent protein translocase protein TatB n=2 Tax=Rhodanobacter TaxID=75309 RepID=I4VTR1_9GAMM|nr:Sec-independent protein translocase protein TatB [Rhodanobacter spathiphylli]EIL90602.1 twin arginine-targeting protein translocase TatB [Rhodanobacter spathiphylli B39]